MEDDGFLPPLRDHVRKGGSSICQFGGIPTAPIMSSSLSSSNSRDANNQHAHVNTCTTCLKEDGPDHPVTTHCDHCGTGLCFFHCTIHVTCKIEGRCTIICGKCKFGYEISEQEMMSDLGNILDETLGNIGPCAPIINTYTAPLIPMFFHISDTSPEAAHV
jgi:hypothetical protein